MIFTANQDARRPVEVSTGSRSTSGDYKRIRTASRTAHENQRTLNKKIRAIVGRRTPLSNDMVETKIQLVECKHLSVRQSALSQLSYVTKYLFGIIEGFACRVLIRLAVIHFEGGKHRVVETNVHANDVMNYSMVLVRFEW